MPKVMASYSKTKCIGSIAPKQRPLFYLCSLIVGSLAIVLGTLEVQVVLALDGWGTLRSCKLLRAYTYTKPEPSTGSRFTRCPWV